MKKNLNKFVKEVVEEVMGINIESFNKSKKIIEISEWDSFNNLMLISKFQDELDVEFPISKIENVLTIEDLYSLIKDNL